MKKLFLAITVTMLFAAASGQRIARITMSQGGTLDMITFEVEPSVMINVTESGNIINWGTDIYVDGRVENFAGKLGEFPGKVEYYSANDNEAFRGKVKYIGKTLITYYGSYDDEVLKGKIKSMAATKFEYYASYDENSLKGKIKNASVPFTYYTSFDNEAYRGKLKSVGLTSVTYYASFDDKAYKGKIKSIDRSSFTYYASFERTEYRGMMKTGFQGQLINGIKFLVRN